MEGRYTEYERRINYYETDKMGIVHHSNYIRFFEEARLDMMKKVGLDYFTMEEAGIIISSSLPAVCVGSNIPVTYMYLKFSEPLPSTYIY